MILIVNICKEKLHYYEFVKPIEDIVKDNFLTKHYLEITEKDLRDADKIIICGTSLKDNCFLESIENFSWLKDFDKPVLGICAGMQILGAIFEAKKKTKKEIGFYFENFKKEFLGLKTQQEVYHLHKNHFLFDADWDIFCEGNGIQQAVKHKEKQFYGVLFHPEVRQKEVILKFSNKK